MKHFIARFGACRARVLVATAAAAVMAAATPAWAVSYTHLTLPTKA